MIKTIIDFAYCVVGICIVLLIVVSLSSCVTQPKNNYKQTNADKIINCIKRMGEDRSLIGRHKICAEIYKQKD